MKLTKSNKKYIIIGLVAVAVICAIVAIIISQTTKLTNESYANCAVGDINGDGFINTDDALIIEKFVKSDIDLFDTQQKNADVNVDGKIDRTDAEWILKYTTGLIRKLPVTGDGDENAPISNNDKLIRHKTDSAETTIKVVNKWANGDGTYSYQLNISIRNLKDSRLKGWETTIVADEEIEKSKSWDCECEVKDNTIIIEGEAIPTETVGVCGVIVKGSDELAFESVETKN